MKLVIQTQYKENYSAHNEDWVGPSENDHWKFKGGETYVVANIQTSILYTGSVSCKKQKYLYSRPCKKSY